MHGPLNVKFGNAKQEKQMTNTYCCVYSVETRDDGQQICPKYVEHFIKINLRNSVYR